jgi:hypothetical protein
VCFCLGGTTLASCGGDGRIVLWSGENAEWIAALTGRFTGRFDVLAVTPDGRRLIGAGGPRQLTAAGPGGLEIWDLPALRRAVLDAGLPDWTAE